ncbi:Uncharacterised protein [Mycobacteroides abscessus subsp. bolletii]|uniref:hypothetical protein n=1 Tax=Mycobacteroides abscessus TaxID=36809 RepID=UPI0009A7BBA7|nr:hypothetical protein [Mycobacteroides abscessus]SLB52108.1 Uncharacterised protein [Mycobacteroides abscessus subsp. bolletii]
MATVRYAVADVVKQVLAGLDYIGRVDAGTEPVAALANVKRLIRGLEAIVAEHLQNIGGDPSRYDDGSPVSSVVTVPGGRVVLWVWDPRLDSPTNRPHMIMEGLRCPDGSAVDVMVTAPGVIDVVQHREPGGDD